MSRFEESKQKNVGCAKRGPCTVVLGAITSLTKKRGQWIETLGLRVTSGLLMSTRNRQDSKNGD